MKRTKLLYFSSSHIVDFCQGDPVDWMDEHREVRHMMFKCGTPEPAMETFYRLLIDRGRLVTQQEYVDSAISMWEDRYPGWQISHANRLGLNEVQMSTAVKARLRTQFWVSGMDTLHVWAMLCETGLFDRCEVDGIDDAVAKVDITATPKRGRDIHIALETNSRFARMAAQHKRSHRGRHPNAIEIMLNVRSGRRDALPGRKHWYTLDDLRPVIEKAGGGRSLPRCPCRQNHRHTWQDSPPQGGRIRTICRECGRFIGYRPEATKKRLS